MTEEPDVYKRRRLWKNLVEGNPTKEDIDFMMQDAAKDVYGELEALSIAEADGKRLDARYNNETRHYYVPHDGAWVSGRGVKLDKAYRIFKEDDKTMTVAEVKRPSEKQAIIQAYLQEARRILDRNKAKKQKE